jgi:hypothetical protein
MGQPQSLPQHKRASAGQHIYFDGSKDDEPNDDHYRQPKEDVHDEHPDQENKIQDDDGMDALNSDDPPIAETHVHVKNNDELLEIGDVQKEEKKEEETPTTLSATVAATTTTPTTTIKPLMIDSFQDHYSLGTSSTTLRFRSRHMRIFDGDRNHQLILEERKEKPKSNVGTPTHTNTAEDPTVATVKLTSTTNFGMALARTLFTLPALFIMTCTFCFSVQTILFLFMNIVAVETPDTWTQSPPAMAIVGATLAVPLLLYGLGSGMAMSWALVVDCWRGLSSEQSLLKNMVVWDTLLTEWICLSVFGGIPLLTLIVTTLARNDNWYELTIGSWAVAVLIFQTFYMLLIFLNELNMCAQLLKHFMLSTTTATAIHENQPRRRHVPTWIQLIQTNVLLTQRQKYSGVRHERYLVQGDALPPPEGFSSDSRFFPVQWHLKLGSRITLDGFLMVFGQVNRTFFHVLDPPQRSYSMDEVFGTVMILSKNNWSLER